MKENGQMSEKNIKSYRKKKIKIMERDFYIMVTAEQKNQMNKLNDVYEIDKFCHKIIFASLR